MRGNEAATKEINTTRLCVKWRLARESSKGSSVRVRLPLVEAMISDVNCSISVLICNVKEETNESGGEAVVWMLELHIAALPPAPSLAARHTNKVCDCLTISLSR